MPAKGFLVSSRVAMLCEVPHPDYPAVRCGRSPHADCRHWRLVDAKADLWVDWVSDELSIPRVVNVPTGDRL